MTRLIPTFPFLEFEWRAAAAHDWHDWPDANGVPVVLDRPDESLLGLETPAVVELTWKDLGNTTGPVLVPSSWAWDSTEYRRYHPLRDHAALFRLFAAVDYEDQDAIRTFANTYGRLVRSPQQQNNPRDLAVMGESQLFWAYEICLMREAIKFDTAYRGGYQPSADNWHRFSWLLQRQVQGIQGMPVGIPPRLSIEPLTLLSALWLQFFQAFTFRKEYIACRFCGQPIELSTDEIGSRRDRAFCSATCRTNDYRARKRTARQLATQGSTIKAIATHIKTPQVTVRKWVAATKKKG